jgi:hypothetical protein
MKLNGWQRLWVVTSITLLIPTLLFIVDNFPTKETLSKNKEHSLSNINSQIERLEVRIINLKTGKEEFQETKTSNGVVHIDLRSLELYTGHQELTKDEKIIFLNKRIEMFKKDKISQEMAFQKSLQNLGIAQLKHIFYMLLLWLISCLGIYTVCWTIVKTYLWVYAGFKVK